MQYQGVDVQHPRIVEAIKVLAKQGKSTQEIAKVVGMPHEVVDSVKREMKKSG